MKRTSDEFHVAGGYQLLMREIGLDAEAVWTHPDIRVWRSIPERENGTLDAARPDGSTVRLHVKRYHATDERPSPAEQEAQGIQLLQRAGIGTVPLAGWGTMRDGRAFVLTEDLAGYAAADKVLGEGSGVGVQGSAKDRVLDAVVDLAAKLHAAGLHHRDLYLCHFFVKADDTSTDVRLIDAARVRPLPGWPLRRRWIVKDLAQLWYSLAQIGLPDERRLDLMERYGRQRRLRSVAWLRRSVEAKVRRIARHDRNLRRRQPDRNISIPQDG